MLAVVPPAAGGAAAAPIRLAMGPGLTTLSNHPVAPAMATSPLQWTLPRDSPAIASLKFLKVERPVAPAPMAMDAIEVRGVCLAAADFNQLNVADQTALNPTTARSRPTDAVPRGPPRRLLTPHGLARWPPDGSRGPSECE